MGTPVLAPNLNSGFLARKDKELLRFVVVGSVDDGKSTLIGRLLYETQALCEDQVAQVRRASKQEGGEIDFSLFTDGLRAEREQGITIDVAYRYFSTATRKFIVADTPGHVQYTRNMATGASTADLAIILLDARLGVLPQSRRHAYIASLLGIPHLLVAVNKMDLAGFDEAVYRRLRSGFGAFAERLGFSSVSFIPVCARLGDNVVTRSVRTPWYRGPTLLEALERASHSRGEASAPLRFPVQIVLRPNLGYRGFAGQLVSGSVRPGSEVVVWPSGRRTRVLAVDAYEGELQEAYAPMSVTLRLTDEVDVSRGDLLAGVESAPTVASRLEAMLVWLAERPFDPSRSYLIKHTTRTVPALGLDVRWRLDLETLKEISGQALEMNDIGRVAIELKRPVVVDLYEQSPRTGAFIVIDALTNATVGAGMVTQALSTELVGRRPPRGPVSAAERRERFGHRSGLVAIRGELAEATALGKALERSLFDARVVAVFVESHAAALACAAAGLVALWVISPGSPGSETEGHPVVELPACTAVDAAVRQLSDLFLNPYEA